MTNAAIINPRGWRLPDPDRVISLLKSFGTREVNSKLERGSLWNFSDGVSPLDLYCYLKMRFGPPNGFAMTLKSPSVDNLIHWHYTLGVEDKVIDIMGLNVRTEIRIYEIGDLKQEDWQNLEKNLNEEFQTHRKELSVIRDGLERWHLFINPYRRLSVIVDQYVDRLEQLNLKGVRVPRTHEFAEDPTAYQEAMRACQEVYREASALTVSLQMIAPVMGEAVVNFLALILAKPEVKKDRRLFEDLVRRNIDVRIKSLSLFCVGFLRSIDGSEEPFKDFLRLMNRRNDTLHGNVDPRRSTGEEIFFDYGTIPLMRRYRSLSEIAISQVLASVEPDQALADVTVVRRFVDFLLSCLEPEYKYQAQMVLRELQPGYRPETNRIGVIIPYAQVDIWPHMGAQGNGK